MEIIIKMVPRVHLHHVPFHSECNKVVSEWGGWWYERVVVAEPTPFICTLCLFVLTPFNPHHPSRPPEPFPLYIGLFFLSQTFSSLFILLLLYRSSVFHLFPFPSISIPFSSIFLPSFPSLPFRHQTSPFPYPHFLTLAIFTIFLPLLTHLTLSHPPPPSFPPPFPLSTSLHVYSFPSFLSPLMADSQYHPVVTRRIKEVGSHGL